MISPREWTAMGVYRYLKKEYGISIRTAQFWAMNGKIPRGTKKGRKCTYTDEQVQGIISKLKIKYII